MKRFKDINVDVFFGFINDVKIYRKVSKDKAINVISGNEITVDENERIVVLF